MACFTSLLSCWKAKRCECDLPVLRCPLAEQLIVGSNTREAFGYEEARVRNVAQRHCAQGLLGGDLRRRQDLD